MLLPVASAGHLSAVFASLSEKNLKLQGLTPKILKYTKILERMHQKKIHQDRILGWFLKIHQEKKYTPLIHPFGRSFLSLLQTNQVTFACLHGPKARFDACWIRVTPSTGDATSITLGSFAWFGKQTTGSLRGNTRFPGRLFIQSVYLQSDL